MGQIPRFTERLSGLTMYLIPFCRCSLVYSG